MRITKLNATEPFKVALNTKKYITLELNIMQAGLPHMKIKYNGVMI